MYHESYQCNAFCLEVTWRNVHLMRYTILLKIATIKCSQASKIIAKLPLIVFKMKLYETDKQLSEVLIKSTDKSTK